MKSESNLYLERVADYQVGRVANHCGRAADVPEERMDGIGRVHVVPHRLSPGHQQHGGTLSRKALRMQ